MNTHEQFITLETAKLAKQAGFDWEVRTYYNTILKELSYCYCTNVSNSSLINEGYDDGEAFTIPTQAVLQRWLREVKKIHLLMAFSKAEGWYAYILDTDEYSGTYLTYESALEAGLQMCLTLIINKKEK